MLFNIIIAILGNVFAVYDEHKVGLYYEVIISMFPLKSYDEYYGSVACAN